MTGQGPTTLHQVAKLAGVSIATVSRVVRGVDQVSSETQRRVHEAIEQLGYRPSHLGQALVNRRHGAVGIVIPGLQGPYYPQLIHGFEEVAIERNLALLILGTHLLRGNDDQVLSLADRTDGLAITGGAIGEPLIERLAKSGKRVVLMAQHPAFDLPTVRVDNYSSMLQLVRHLLIDHGYERLAFIGNITASPDPEDRWLGFLAAHREAGKTPPDGPLEVGMEETAGTFAANQLLSSSNPPRAIVCANDELAMGVLSVAHSRGIRVPEDLAVTGFDDIPFASVTAPPLTTIRQPSRELGARAASILLDGSSDTGFPGNEIVLPTDLVIRASCGCGHQGTLIDDLNASATGSANSSTSTVRREKGERQPGATNVSS
jgi:LacI family transcriptional regulator